MEHTAETFAARSTHATRGLQAYLTMIHCAAKGGTMTYDQLTEAMKWGAPHISGHPLARVEQWCMQKGLPPLTVIVVQKDGGRPGAGIVAVKPDEFEAELRRVLDFDWLSILPPTPEALEAAFNHRTAG